MKSQGIKLIALRPFLHGCGVLSAGDRLVTTPGHASQLTKLGLAQLDFVPEPAVSVDIALGSASGGASSVVGTGAGSQAGTQEGAQAGTEAGAQAGTEEGAQAGTETGAQAGTEAGAKVSADGGDTPPTGSDDGSSADKAASRTRRTRAS